MKLRHSTTSPYVRKCLIVALEAGLMDGIELVPTTVGPDATDIGRVNPLAKIPALILDGGEVLYDSPVICEYLDSLHDGVPMFPPAGGARWLALRRQALADGLMDATVLRRLERMRSEGERSSAWIDRQMAKISVALDALETEADTFGDAHTIGEIAIACALAYIDLRSPELEWRRDRPALADWYDTFSARPSMVATEFVA